MATLEKPKQKKKQTVPSKTRNKTPGCEATIENASCSKTNASSELNEEFLNDSIDRFGTAENDTVIKTKNIQWCETETCDTESDLENNCQPSAPLLENEVVISYPVLPVQIAKPTIKPFMESQLMSLYSNQEIMTSKRFVESFVESELRGLGSKNHPLYELTINYLKSKDKLKINQLEMNRLKLEYKTCQNELWSLETAIVKRVGNCQDGATVHASHEYLVAKFQKSLLESLVQIQNKIKKCTNEVHVLRSYTTAVLKLKIDHYIQNVIAACCTSANLSADSSVVLLQIPLGPHIERHVRELRLCISVLFAFQRQIYKDEEFILETKEWLTSMIAVLLRLADWQDHMFLLNQVLRCPAGVGSWACTFIQIPSFIPDSDSPFANRVLNHIVAMLNVLLCPVEKRDCFLEQFLLSKSDVQDAVSENIWILVDSDGEEDENTGISSLKENDLVALLNQLPIDELFKYVMLIETKDHMNIYDGNKIDENHILRMFAFSTVLVRIFYGGILTYNTARYHQFAKRLCRLIRQTLQYSSDMWQIFRSQGRVAPDVLERLQVEFDSFFLRTSVLLYSAQKLGAWQFLAIVPFHTVSIQVLWKFFYMLHESDMSDEIIDIDFKMKLNEVSVRQTFDEKLCIMSAEESYYLLNTFANMIMSRDIEDYDFIEFATIKLLEIGFYGLGTQDDCSKCAAIVLSNIANKHPRLISSILSSVKDNMCYIGQLCKYLFDELPLKIWHPSDKDIAIITSWLLQNSLSSTESHLARLILARLNWESQSDFCLAHDLHRRTALLVCEAVEKLVPDVGCTLLDGVRQTVQTTSEQIFVKWCWQMVFRLRLHASDRMCFDMQSVPDVTQFDVIQKGLREQRPLAIFLGMMMTTIGHLVPVICQHGLAQLQVLSSCYKYDAVLIVLHHIVPLFENCKELLLSSSNFQAILITLCAADRTYVKMAKSLIVTEFPGSLLRQFASMIESHIHGRKWQILITFWVQSLVVLPNWSKDPGILYLLNIILRTGFFNSISYEGITDIFKQLLEKTDRSPSNSSILNWISNNQNTSLLSGGSYAPHPWLAYVVISLEHDHVEVRTGLWKELLKQLHTSTGKTSVDNSLKKSASLLKVQYFKSSNLCLYRWAQQALDTPVEHPLLPLLWQKFFTLYLSRVPSSTGARGCVGNKFFDGMVNMSFCKKLKKHLQESVDYFKGKIDMQQTEGTDQNEGKSKEFHERCLRLYKAFILWLEEPLLQDNSLHVPSLPSQYETQYLASILQQSTSPWIEFVNFEKIHSEHQQAQTEWDSTCFRNSPLRSRPLQIINEEFKDPVEQILRRLGSHDKPQTPPALAALKPLIPPLNISSKNTLSSILQLHLTKLERLAELYALQVSEHASLDCEYNELIHQLYTSVPTKLITYKICESTCSGRATIVLNYRESRMNESVKYQIQNNRTNFGTLLTRSMQPATEQTCMTCVSIELSINLLQSRLEESSVTDDKTIRDIGVEFFYLLLSLYNDQIKSYPPTNQLFNSCMDKLGQVFIHGVETETIKLCKAILSQPHRNELLVPHFTAANVSTVAFLQLYGNICDKIEQLPNISFALLSKFNINKWLIEKSPRLADRSKFIQLVFKSLTKFGFNPTKDSRPLHELFRQHLVGVYRHEFPEHYGEVLLLALQNSGNQNLAISAFMDLLHALASPAQILPDIYLREQLRHIATHQTMLQQRELIDTTTLLAKYFMQERLQYGLYGLYPKYRVYIEPLETLLGITGHAVTVATLKVYRGLLADQLSELLWPNILEMFSPWLIPYWLQHYKNSTASWILQLADDRSVLLPWTSADINYAQRIFNMFVDCVQFMIDTLPACNNILGFVWQFYTLNYAHVTIKAHVLIVAHNSLKNLPWDKFWPSSVDLESMLKMVDQYIPECHNFLGHVFLEINWTSWLSRLTTGNIVGTMRAHHCLFYLLVKLSNEPNIRQSIKSQSILEKSKEYSWYLLDTNSLEQVFDWYVQSCDPRVILAGEDIKIIDKSVLSLLKIVSCMDTTIQSSDVNAMKKRQCFLRAYVKLLTNCSSRHKMLVNNQPKHFQEALKNELDHLEQIINDCSKDPIMESDLLLSELSAVLNNGVLSSTLLDCFEDWISSRTADSKILQSFLRTIGNSIASADTAGALLESALTSYFMTSVSQSTEPSWSQVIKIFNAGTPKQPPLEQSLVANGQLLTLHAILLKRIGSCDDDGLHVLLDVIVDWTGNIKLVESIETKLPLLWSQILKLAFRMCDRETANTAASLKRFVSHLLTMSESKGLNWGRNILGAIGIGKHETVSMKYRFLCKSLAGYVLAQLPDSKGGPQTIRCFPGAPGPIGQPGGNSECAKILLKLDSRNAELKTCIEIALTQIQDPQNSLHNAVEFMFSLVDLLYSKPYLKI